LATPWRRQSAPLVSAKFGLVGNHGQLVLATLVKSAVMHHVLVFAVAPESLANQVAAGARSKRALVLLARVNGASGTRPPSARQSNPDAALDPPLMPDRATEDQATVQALRLRRKCANSTPVPASPSGESGRLAR